MTTTNTPKSPRLKMGSGKVERPSVLNGIRRIVSRALRAGGALSAVLISITVLALGAIALDAGSHAVSIWKARIEQTTNAL